MMNKYISFAFARHYVREEISIPSGKYKRFSSCEFEVISC